MSQDRHAVEAQASQGAVFADSPPAQKRHYGDLFELKVIGLFGGQLRLQVMADAAELLESGKDYCCPVQIQAVYHGLHFLL